MVQRIYHVSFLYYASPYGSINSKRAHPPQARLLLLPHRGEGGICQRGSAREPGLGHRQKQLGLSDFKCSIWFHSDLCKYLYNCFHSCEREMAQAYFLSASTYFVRLLPPVTVAILHGCPERVKSEPKGESMTVTLNI